MLLDLPSELVLKIFDYLDPKALSAVVLTCRTARILVKHSSSLLRDKIDELPGYDTYASEPEELWAIFQKRAALHLQNANIKLVDASLFKTSRSVGRTGTIVHACTCGLRHLIFASYGGDGSIRVYKTTAQGVELRHVVPAALFDEELAGIQDKIPQEEFQFSHFAFLQGHNPTDCVPDLGVLYTCPKIVRKSEHERAELLVDCRSMRFISYTFDWLQGPSVAFRKNINVPVAPPIMDPMPTALAYTTLNITIALASRYERYWRTDVLVLHDKPVKTVPLSDVDDPEGTEDPIKYRHWAQRCPYEKGHKYGLADSKTDVKITRIESAKLRSRFSSNAFPCPTFELYHGRTLSGGHGTYTEAVDTSLPIHSESFTRPFLGQLLTWFHRCGTPSVDPNRKECINTTLQIVINDGSSGLAKRSGAYILKAVEQTHTCARFDPLAHHPVAEHVIVAKLVGINVMDVASTGIQLAISPSRARIAMSNWKSVYVWAIDPDAFLNASLLPEGEFEDDLPYTQSSGHEYYWENLQGWSDANDLESQYKEVVPLFAEELPEMGVVYSLEFGQEDELWAWTDAGLARWDFGNGGRAKRERVLLDETRVCDSDGVKDGKKANGLARKGKGKGKGKASAQFRKDGDGDVVMSE